MSTALDDMRAIVSSQQQAEADAREATRVQNERAKEAAYAAAVEKLGAYIPDSVLNGRWTVHKTTLRMTSWRDGELALVSTFLPDDMRPLVLLGNWFHTDAGRGPEALQLERQGTSHSVFIHHRMSAEQIMGLLAPLVVEYVEDCEALERRRQQEERQRQADEARKARIDGKLDEMEALYGRAIKLDLDRIEAAWGWPQNRTLTVYYVEWTVGVDSEGDVQRASGWSLTADPDADGFYEVLGREKLVRRKIVSPVIVATERVWSSLDDVPGELRQAVSRTRVLRVYEWHGAQMRWVGERRVYERRYLPGPCLRSQMGYAVEDVPEDGLPHNSNVGGPLVPVVMTADGFEPCDPEQGVTADDVEELPY